METRFLARDTGGLGLPGTPGVPSRQTAGRYQLEGEPVQMLLPGDTVVIPPKARHWHGGAPDNLMTHLALSETSETGEATTWLEPVSDGDYLKAPAKSV